MNKLVEYLKKNITDKIAIEDIVGVFEKMCQFPVENDMILFETGTFDFTGEPLFYFSLVRQFSNDEEEYFQIHVDILYKSTSENKVFQKAVWNEDLSENIFDYIRNSQAFAFAKKSEYIQVEVLYGRNLEGGYFQLVKRKDWDFMNWMFISEIKSEN